MHSNFRCVIYLNYTTYDGIRPLSTDAYLNSSCSNYYYIYISIPVEMFVANHQNVGI